MSTEFAHCPTCNVQRSIQICDVCGYKETLQEGIREAWYRVEVDRDGVRYSVDLCASGHKELTVDALIDLVEVRNKAAREAAAKAWHQ